jgi:hypothetical protein
MVILQHQLGLKLNMVSHRVQFWDLCFSSYDLPKFINDKFVPILFTDDTSILVSHPNPMVFYNTINTVFQTLNDWFRHNLLSLNFAETRFIKFITKNNNQTEINIKYDKLIPAIT